MAEDGADVFFRHAFRLQQLPGVGQMLLRIVLIIHVVQIADGLPVLLVRAEMLCHGAHGGGNGQGVQEQMFVVAVFRQDGTGLIQSELTHNISFDSLSVISVFHL